MKILGINTATIFGSVGLVDNGRLMAEQSLNVPITHSERLLKCIDQLLVGSKVDLEEMDGFSIALGPGSFTGLRIGISTVKGLGFATERPLAGVSTLEALARNICSSSRIICPILDARKKEVYTARFQRNRSGSLKRLSQDTAISPRNLVEEIQGPAIFLGDGVEAYGKYLKRKLGRLAVFAPPEHSLVRGAVVARLGMDRIARGETLDLARIGPQYIRRSEAEIKYEEKSIRQITQREAAHG